MSSLIQNGMRDGVVIDGAGSYANGRIRADGVGNINVQRGANVGSIINKTDLNNSILVNGGSGRKLF